MEKIKLAIFASHPIQYQAPFFKAINLDGRIKPTVYFSDRGAIEESYDSEFGRKIKWDIPLLDGYEHFFLKGRMHLPLILLFKKTRFDAILIFGWNSIDIFLVYLAALFSGTKILMRAESPLNQELLKFGVFQKAKKIFLKLFFKKIKAFLYIGEENRRFYKYLGVPDSRLFFVPYAVDNDRFFKEAEVLLPKKEEIRDGMGIKRDAKVVLFVGKLIDKKRPKDLLVAYKDLDIKNKALIFVGDGSLRQELEDYVQKNNLSGVYFVGFKNQTEISEYYAIADVFVLPSGAGETWGLVVNEAMCFGLPVVVSNLVGCGLDLVNNDNSGYIFKMGDIKEMKEVILRAFSLADKKEKNQSRSLIKNYDYSRGINSIVSVLKD